MVKVKVRGCVVLVLRMDGHSSTLQNWMERSPDAARTGSLACQEMEETAVMSVDMGTCGMYSTSHSLSHTHTHTLTHTSTIIHLLMTCVVNFDLISVAHGCKYLLTTWTPSRHRG